MRFSDWCVAPSHPKRRPRVVNEWLSVAVAAVAAFLCLFLIIKQAAEKLLKERNKQGYSAWKVCRLHGSGRTDRKQLVVNGVPEEELLLFWPSSPLHSGFSVNTLGSSSLWLPDLPLSLLPIIHSQNELHNAVVAPGSLCKVQPLK